MRALSFIKGALLYTGGNFSSLDNFMLRLSEYIKDVNVGSKKEIFSLINDEITSIREKVGKRLIGEDEALLLLMCDDLENLIKHQDSVSIHFDLEEDVANTYNKLLELYNEIGIQIDKVPYFIVSDYPSPYNHLKGAALCPDKSDQNKFNITPGIYFRKDKMVPIQSTLTLAHEMIHFVIGKRDHHLLARGIEEGICEFLGIAFCGYKLFGQQVPLNYLIHRRLKFSGHKQKFQLYMDYFRTVTYIYLIYGMDAIVSLVNSGRSAVKITERNLTNMNYELIPFPVSQASLQDDIFKLSSYVSLIFPENEVVSPLSYWISKNIGELKSVEQIIDVLNVEPKQAKNAINDLERRIFAILIDNGNIEYSDISTIIQLKSYRYEI